MTSCSPGLRSDEQVELDLNKSRQNCVCVYIIGHWVIKYRLDSMALQEQESRLGLEEAGALCLSACVLIYTESECLPHVPCKATVIPEETLHVPAFCRP